jgi:predicted dienelactone hydrolase
MPRHTTASVLIGFVICLQPLAATAEQAAPPPATPDPAPSQPYPSELTPGPFEVTTHKQVEFQRKGRDLPLPLLVRHPVPTEENPGPFPLVVFSHGMGGYTDAFEHLSTHLASHGYTVIHPAHTDSIKLRREAGESADSLRRTFTPGGTSSVDLQSRIDDCIWILQNARAIEAEIERTGLIDTTRAAVAGHSAGAMTTQILAGLRFYPRLARRGRSLADGSDFDAYIVISGQGTTRPSLNDQSWQGITKPMLVLSGTEDTSRVSDETPESRRHPYEFAPRGDKYLIHITGATHSSYQGAPAPNADAKRIEALTTHASLAFLNLYLKQTDAAQEWLANTNRDKFQGIDAEYLNK